MLDLNLKWPIIQAPMAGVQDAGLTVAVCEAGGLGSLPCGMLGATQIAEQVSAIKAGTQRPYNVNFFCHQPPEADAKQEAGWIDALTPYYEEYGVVPKKMSGKSSRQPFGAETLNLLKDLAPPVVSFHFGLPSAEMVAGVKSWGAKVISTATTVDEARWLEEHGADAIIAQGWEAGGHRGHFLSHDLKLQRSTFPLLSAVLNAVNLPIIAAGGIGNAEAVRRALSAGASAVQCGTAFLLCPEMLTTPLHRKALTSGVGSEVTNLISGRPARCIVNRIIEDLGPISERPTAFPTAGVALAPLRAAAEASGKSDFSPIWSGQNPGCDAIPAADMLERLGQGALNAS